MAMSSTDIVERLRKPADIEQFRDPAKLIGEMLAEQIEAADEIERLREALRAIVERSETYTWAPEHVALRDIAREALGDE